MRGRKRRSTEAQGKIAGGRSEKNDRAEKSRGRGRGDEGGGR